MKIYGAGLAGLICGSMMRDYHPIIREQQASLPNNHAALLRFRSDLVEKATGIRFRRVKVRKGVQKTTPNRIENTATLHDHNRYSLKVSGRIMERSILNLEDAVRYIAPSDLVSRLGEQTRIEYSTSLIMKKIEEARAVGEPIISTIPMPSLMDIVGWKGRPAFFHKAVWSINTNIKTPDCDVYQTIYFPHHAYIANANIYRASITGKRLTIEMIGDPGDPPKSQINSLLFDSFGINADVGYISVKMQKYGKILPIDDELRRAFIYSMSEKYGIYSLGRFATWRQIQLDDVVNDVHQIEKLINSSSYYNRLYGIQRKE